MAEGAERGGHGCHKYRTFRRWLGCCSGGLDGQKFSFFPFADLVDLPDLVVGKFLEFCFGTVEVVLGDLVVVFQAADVFVAVAADVADGDAGFFDALTDVLGEFAAAVFG